MAGLVSGADDYQDKRICETERKHQQWKDRAPAYHHLMNIHLSFF